MINKDKSILTYFRYKITKNKLEKLNRELDENVLKDYLFILDWLYTDTPLCYFSIPIVKESYNEWKNNLDNLSYLDNESFCDNNSSWVYCKVKDKTHHFIIPRKDTFDNAYFIYCEREDNESCNGRHPGFFNITRIYISKPEYKKNLKYEKTNGIYLTKDEIELMISELNYVDKFYNISVWKRLIREYNDENEENIIDENIPIPDYYKLIDN